MTARIQPGKRRPVEGVRPASQHREPVAALAKSRQGRGRHVDPRGPNAAASDAVLAKDQAPVRVQFEPGRPRRHRSPGGPRDEGVEGRLPDVVLLRAGVDREVGGKQHDLSRRLHQFGERRRREAAVVLGRGEQRIGVNMGGSGHLPQPEMLAVGLAGAPPPSRTTSVSLCRTSTGTRASSRMRSGTARSTDPASSSSCPVTARNPRVARRSRLGRARRTRRTPGRRGRWR